MNRVSKRAWLVLIGSITVLAGLFLFLFRYVTQAQDWVTFPGNPHLYHGINPDTGIVTDRQGTVLVDSTGERTYSDDPVIRQATMHLLGDRFGYIEAPLLGEFTGSMINWTLVGGLQNEEEDLRKAQLTLSAEAQKTALTALAGRKGTVGVYNYKTGEIICAVTSPTYDPDQVPDIAADTTGAYDGVYVNRFFRATYTPGSIFKCLTTLAALDQIPDVEQMTFYCSGETIIDGERIICAGVHGYQDLAAVLRNSCNVGIGEISVLLGAEKLDSYVEQAGIRSSLQFDGLTTKGGSFDVSAAGKGSLAWAGIGQHTNLINPCQYMVFMGMLANGGKAAQPYLMEKITSDDTVFYEAETVWLESGFDSYVVQRTAEMMRENVIYGYGDWLFPGMSVCAKSGTAETVEGKANNALFAGFVIDENCPLAFIVVVEEGGSGASAAAPVAAEVLQVCKAHLEKS